MIRRILLAGLWIVLMGYAFILAPPNQPDTLDLIQRLSTGQWDMINPWITSLFNGMGIWPMIYAAFLFIDGRGQRIPAWPFAIASFFLGAFALLPYLILREPEAEFSGELTPFLRFWESRWLGVGLGLAAFSLVTYGFTQGNWTDFVEQWQSSRFIHVMGLDFCLLSLLIILLIHSDRLRRQEPDRVPQWLSYLPFFGPILYLTFRSSLKENR